MLSTFRTITKCRFCLPLAFIFSTFSCILGLLFFSISTVPGIYYWDIVSWLDFSNRIDHKQLPYIDFFSPIGPLPQYAFWIIHKIFPNANPVLSFQYSYALICIPLFTLLILNARQCNGAIVLLGIVFSVLLLTPANFSMPFFTFGIDGFGIYNRQSGLLLYILLMSILWCRPTAAIVATIILTLLFLFLTKITAFVGAFVFVLYFFVSGRLTSKQIGLIFLVVSLFLGGLEAVTGIVSAYIKNIGLLLNPVGSFTAYYRMQDPFHRLIHIVFSSLILLIPLGLLTVTTFCEEVNQLANHHNWPRGVLVNRWVVLCVALVIAVVIESQNSGSQQFAFLFPLVLFIFFGSARVGFFGRASKILATAFMVIVGTKAVERDTLISYQASKLPQLNLDEVRVFRISARPEDVSFANSKLLFFSAQQTSYRNFAERGLDLSPDSDEAFQLTYFISVANAVRALHQWEKDREIKLKTVVALDYVDPFAVLLNTTPLVGLGVVMDPYRGIGQVVRIQDAWAKADGILQPLCPINNRRLRYTEMAKAELDSRKVVSIDPCWNLFLKSKD